MEMYRIGIQCQSPHCSDNDEVGTGEEKALKTLSLRGPVPPLPPALGLGHYSLLNRTFCEEMLGVNAVHTGPEIEKEWSVGF